ncbi:Retinoic acid receptor alpha-B [Dissostichus eleginoides]|uniref:Retinoic acid receptor alpha-B n=1 Tax=Dissostichus eleginoides TaxID=100907 RepID=A0AAD9BDK0_DISEL|nr:Retinoic acid receptor alpha-B [Dissostichus eleginoides]
MMYESVDVVGLTPSPNPFLMMDYYNQSRGCLIPEKGLVPGAPHPYSTSIRNQHWNGSNHCYPQCERKRSPGISIESRRGREKGKL